MATALLMSLHMRALVRSRRMLVCIVLASLPPLFAFIALHFGPDEIPPDELIAVVAFFMSLQVVAPLVSLVVGSAVVNEEVENRTITYPFTRPIPRSAFFIGRWFATALVVAALLGASAALVGLAAGGTGEPLPEGLVLRLVGASIAGACVYPLLFAVLGVFLRRPMIVGLGYTFLFEGILANVPGGNQSLSIQYYLRSICLDPSLEVWQETGPFIALGLQSLSTPLAAVHVLSIVLVTFLTVGAVAISRRQYVLSS